MNAQTTIPDGPLGGLLVLDLSHALAGPHAAMMLGDLGARVIKVEPPGGDETRGWGPPFARPPDPDAPPESTYFLSCNRNKQSVTADLKTDHGRDLVERLIRHSDVLVENFRPGVLDRLGLGPERLRELNPALIVLSISGFGHDGPHGGRPGYDQIAQGEAGLMSLTGEPGTPTKTGVPVADLLAGIFGVCATLAALIERQNTGRGRTVRTSLLSAIVGIHSFQGTRWTVAGQTPEATGNQHPAIAPYGLFHCADADIQIAAGSQALWRALATVVGINPDDPHYATNADRVRHRTQLHNDLETRLAHHNAEHWLHHLSTAGIPAGRIRTLDEVYRWEQTRHQAPTIDVNHATLGPITLPGPPWRFDDQAPTRHTPPPTLGQHDESIRAWLDALDAPDATKDAADTDASTATRTQAPAAPPPPTAAPPTTEQPTATHPAPEHLVATHPTAEAATHAPTAAALLPPAVAHRTAEQPTTAHPAAAHLAPDHPTAAHPTADAAAHAPTAAALLPPAVAHRTAEKPTAAHSAVSHLAAEHLTAAHSAAGTVVRARTAAVPLPPATAQPIAAHPAADAATYVQTPAVPLLPTAAPPAPEHVAAAHLPTAYPATAPSAAEHSAVGAAAHAPTIAPLLPAAAHQTGGHQTAEQPAVAAQLAAAHLPTADPAKSPAAAHPGAGAAAHARASGAPLLPTTAYLATASLAAEHMTAAHPPTQQPAAHPVAEQPVVAHLPAPDPARVAP